MGIYGEAHGRTEELVKMDRIADQSNVVVFDAKPLTGASGLACLMKWQATDGSERIEEGVARYMWDAGQSHSVMARSVQDSAFCEPVADGKCAVATTGSALAIVDFATPESDPTVIPLPTGASATALLAFRDGFMCVLTSGAAHIYSGSEGLSSAVMALDATQPVRMMAWVPTLDSAVALCGDGPQLLRLLNPVTGEIPPEYAIENQDDEMASLGPITDLKMVSMLDRQATSQTAFPDGTTAIGSPNGSNGVTPGHYQPACLVLSGRGQHSQLRALGYGVGMLKLGSTPLPGRATAIFTIEDEVRTKYMLISFVDVTLVL
ncbi:ubiquitin-specific protease ubp15, partial [Perkinsus olseni]